MNRPSLGSEMFQNLFGLLRLLVLMGVLGFFCSRGSMMFDGVVPNEVAQQYRDAFPLLALLPNWMVVPFAAVVNESSWRYAIAPGLAILCVFFAGAYYVRDIYALPTFSSALNYVMASLFSSSYPELIIDGGTYQFPKDKVNLIDKIGGPGYVIVEPGSAAVFRHLREISRPVVGDSYFLAPFEIVAQTVGLDEQQGDRDEISAMTRDGIRVVLRDVHFRYRIRQRVVDGRTVQRTPENPFPFDPSSLTNMIANLTVQSNGLDRWNVAVERAVTGLITNFISANTIDFLTAPSKNGNDPRRQLQIELFPGVRRALEDLGAELLWVDAGHMEVVYDQVNEKRRMLWAAEWIGDSNITRSYGDALRQAYRDLGRAQAQAEIILSITEALDSSVLAGNGPDNVRRIFLARTAQVIESLARNNPEV